MATKSITITEEAYEYLKDIKGERSFSEVILAFSRSADDIMRYAGSLKDADLSSVEHVRKEANHDWATRS